MLNVSLQAGYSEDLAGAIIRINSIPKRDDAGWPAPII
jgi:hypothetical protein